MKYSWFIFEILPVTFWVLTGCKTRNEKSERSSVKTLLDHQADPDLTDNEEHFTTLMYAAAEGQLDVVRILLAYNADPALKDVDGDDALTFAMNNGHTAIASLLTSFKK
ncbi:MAG: ankyrin repeat domain-containing protein [Bacteroidales bacterium]|nr:ankyrin repeat domain-containing protein [Bacteroidales bacterium]